MICTLAARIITIISYKNITFIVLMQTRIFDIVALLCNEISSPKYFWHEVVNSHNFCLSGDFSVELLFSESENWKYKYQR